MADNDKTIGTECPKCGGLAGIIGEPDTTKHKVEITCQTAGCGNKWTTPWPPKQVPTEVKRAREAAARTAAEKPAARA
jgi:hypothetical protein